MAKKYYWLKLKQDFFEDKKIKKLRSVAGGDTYTIIYLKMQLLSLKNDGILLYEEVEDNFIEEIALEIDEDVENVKVTILFLIKNKLLEEINDKKYMLSETVKSIGKECESAERVRKLREKEKTKTLQCNSDVTKCNTEIEIDKEIDIDNIYISSKNEKTDLKNKTSNSIKQIIDYLNEKTNSNYKHNTKNTTKLISARLNEGFTLDDFKKVIDKKSKEWKETEYEKFLTPDTLFSNKFEKYLNQKINENKGEVKYKNYTQRDYTSLEEYYDN